MTSAPVVAASASKPVEIFGTSTPPLHGEEGFASILAKLMGKRVADISGMGASGKPAKKVCDKRSESRAAEDAATPAGNMTANPFPFVPVPLETPAKQDLKEVAPDIGRKTEGAIEQTRAATASSADQSIDLVSTQVVAPGELQPPPQTSVPIASPSEKQAPTPVVMKRAESATALDEQPKAGVADPPPSLADPDASDRAVPEVDKDAVKVFSTAIVQGGKKTEAPQNQRSPSPVAVNPGKASREPSLAGADQSKPGAELNPQNTKVDSSHPARDDSPTVLPTHNFISTTVSTPTRPAEAGAKNKKATISVEGNATARATGHVCEVGEDKSASEAKSKEVPTEAKVAVSASVAVTPVATRAPESPKAQLITAQAPAVQPTGEKPIESQGTHPPEDVPTPHAREIESMVPATSGVQIAHLADAGGQSEMRIGLRTSAFGTVEVRAVVHDSQVGLAIGAERGELHRLFANEVPGISGRLEQQNLRLDAVKFLDHGSSLDAGSGAGSDPRSRESHPSHAFPMNSAGRDESPVETIETIPTLEARSGLNVRA